MNTNETFDAALKNFLDTVWAAFKAQNDKMPMLPNYYQYPTVEAGSKNLRIVCTSGGSRHVYCFIRKEDGAILKSASWKAPAKGVRGSIFNPDTYKNADAYGGAWYR